MYRIQAAIDANQVFVSYDIFIKGRTYRSSQRQLHGCLFAGV